MTDQTIQTSFSYTTGATGQGLPDRLLTNPFLGAPTRFFQARPGSLLRTLAEDFRAVPVEAWIILAVATVMSNLFIALA